MKRNFLIAGMIFCASSCLAQKVSQTTYGDNSPNIKNVTGDVVINNGKTVQAPQGTKPKTPPVIPVELREKFFKAQSEYQGANAQAQQAQAAAQAKNTVLQAEIEKLKTACGADYQPNVDKEGEIICVDKPKAPEPSKK